jgi:hypothetical protein
MPAAYPKPDDQRVNRVEPKFGWTDLPIAGRAEAAPELPKHVRWSVYTKRAWVELWSCPQATQWDPSGRTLHGWAELVEQRVRCERERKTAPASTYAEIRQIEDRHGLNPKAMLQLRWRIVADEVVVSDESPISDRRKRLKVV